MSGQAWLFLSTVAAGAVMGFVYDIFRIARKTARHKGWLVQVEDVLYCAGVSALMFGFMLHRNYGEIRFFVIIGAGLGMLLYFFSLSPVVIKISVAVIRFVQKVLFATARILLGPIRVIIRLGRLLARPCLALARFVRSRLHLIACCTGSKFAKIRRNAKVILKKV